MSKISYSSILFRDINRKEKDLKLLSRLPPDEYLQYENVRKQSAAKVIQTAWRQSNRNPLNYKFQERLSYSTKKKYPIKSAKFFPFRTSKDYLKGKFKRDEEDGEEEMKGEEAKKSLEAIRLEKIVTASFRKKSGIAGGAEYLEQVYEPRNMIDYSMDENAISLSMLYQRIRAQASDRMTKKVFNFSLLQLPLTLSSGRGKKEIWLFPRKCWGYWRDAPTLW